MRLQRASWFFSIRCPRSTSTAHRRVELAQRTRSEPTARPKFRALGTALGNRYKNNTNIIWHIGNDCQSCTLSLQKAFLDAITAADTNHLTTFQYSYFRSYTNQVNSASFASELTLDYVYTYYETYDYALLAYNSSPTIPCFLGEANYEGGNNTNNLSSPANQLILRMENWWTVTSGCPGTVWGNESVNHNDASYPGSLTTTATGEVINVSNLLTKYQWQSLVPDSGAYGINVSERWNCWRRTMRICTMQTMPLLPG